MPKDMPVRRDLPRAHHKTAPYPQLSAPRQEPTTAPKQAQKPTLPPEIQGAILAQNVPWSSKDVRALSQSSHALNAWIRALQPQSYRQAHRMTLAKALTSPRFDMSNRRAQSVLRGLDSLHLLGAPKAVGKRPRLDPCGAHPARLAEVVAAIGPTQAIHLGAETRSMAPWLRLLEAGLQAHALTTLNLAAANLCFNDLEQLGGTFAQLPGLQHLHLPNKVQQGTRRRTQASALSFAPLLSLRTLTWKALIRVPYAEVDLSANRHLRVLKLGLGASASLGFAGWELSAYAPGTTVKLPPAALNVLHLDGLVLSPGTAHHLRDAPWQRTLVELKLNLHPACPFAHIDLGGHTALRHLAIRSRNGAVDGLVLPPAPQLKVLALAGQAMGRVLGQLREPTAKALRALHLDCRLDEAFGASGIPWASLPKLQTLTCSARYVGTLKMELIHLAIPHNHPLEQLGLAHYVKDGWQPEDAALKELSLPRLRTLDLRQLDALNPEFVPAMVTSFDEALGDRTKWPSLQQMVLPAYTFAPDLRAGLMGVAARHGLQLVPAPPTRDPLSP